MKKIITIVAMLCASSFIFAQEALKSFEEEYYDFLSLIGNSKRNYLNYRTMTDSRWTVTENEDGVTVNPWDGNLRNVYTLFEREDNSENWFLSGIDQKLDVQVYGPKWFSSYNTKSPFGVNDGALWQGRGYNTSMTAGLWLEGYGFNVSINPQVSWSQNLAFEIMKPGMEGSEFGHYYTNCDAPQRFGDKSFWTYDWGDSEIRWSWKNFTLGYGTQSIWLGPNYLYPLLLSNNAATFPKFDIGLTRTTLLLPWNGMNLGELEIRGLVGKLTESDYFDKDEKNNHNMYVLYSLSYAPPFIPGLTLGANKVCLTRWDDKDWMWYLNPFYAGQAEEDQKASITADWLLEKVGTEFYAEIGIDDYLPNGLDFYEYARYPFHTMSYSVGIQQAVKVLPEKGFYGKVNFEWNNTEPSQDYQMWGYYNFGRHHQIIQGYTNKGQWLGSGIGYGGNSQYLSFTLFSPHGFDRFFIARNNPDNSYIYGKCTHVGTHEAGCRYFAAFKANFYTGLESMWFVVGGLSIQGSFAYNLIINPLYNPGLTGYETKTGYPVYREKTYLHNFHFEWTLKYTF